MARTSGYGMKAKEARSPSRMPPKKSHPDSGTPSAQYGLGTPPAAAPRRQKSADSGKPTANK